MTKHNLIVILGPTATGKTKVAAQVANKLNGEIISADSRQVYRKLNIGTGKDLTEYVIGNQQIPYHLIDICDIGYKYNLHQFQLDFQRANDIIQLKNKLPILCGGTGLYIQAVLENYQYTAVPINPILREELTQLSKEELLSMLDSLSVSKDFPVDTSKRLIRAIEIGEYMRNHSLRSNSSNPITPLIIGLKASREKRRELITTRLKNRFENGLIEEVAQLLESGVKNDTLRSLGLEYKFVTDHLDGQYDRDTLFEKLNIAIHQFAKRQMTWFRKMERQGYTINWIEVDQPLEDKLQYIMDKFGG